MDQRNLPVFFSVGTVVLMFILWYLVFHFSVRVREQGRDAGEIRRFVLLKTAGLLFFGLIPFIIIHIFMAEASDSVNLMPGVWPSVWYQWILLFAVCAMISAAVGFYMSKPQPEIQRSYPEIRSRAWPWHYSVITVAGWIVYLAGYEYLFRGVLLKGVLAGYGCAVAVIVNVILYSAAHFYKDKKEVIASVPFGIVLCVAGIMSDSVIVPFLLHLTIALSFETYALRRNIKMNLISAS